jgi:SAM-dependent methyltransferase
MPKSILKKIIPFKFYNPYASIYRKISSRRYLGEGFLCPFCKTEFKTFFEFGFENEAIIKHSIIGAGININGTCPSCRSNDRERHIFLYLKEHFSSLFINENKLLHIAPEKNLWELFRKQKNIHYTPAGYDMQLATVRMDITQINIESDYYDVIICNHVLEHVVEDIKAMRELFRVLKRNGFAILQVPISFKNKKTIEDKSIVDSDERRKHFGQSDHVRIYGLDYVSRLESVGFSVDIVDFISELSNENLKKYSLIPEERIFLCRK